MQREPEDFGAYHLIGRLGVGGMAEAFEAARLGPGGFAQHVCLKRVLPAYGDDPRFIERFHREARLAAQLRHSNVVSVIDFGELEGAPYLALELVDGLDLRSFLASRPDRRLPADWVVLVGTDLAHALEHAHHPDRAVVHRDISPSNILLGRSGQAKLADFGLAKTMGNDGATASQTRQGKIPYMAPEQVRAEPVDGRADLFSLGVVLFEALAGERPFDGAHDVETMRRILSGERRDLSVLAPEAPAGLRRIIEKLIATERDARFASAASLVEALAELSPVMRARRELANSIEQERGGPETRKHLQGLAGEADPETVTVAAVPVSEAQPTEPRNAAPNAVKKPGHARLLAVAATALTLSFGLAFVRLGREQPTEHEPTSGTETRAPQSGTLPPVDLQRVANSVLRPSRPGEPQTLRSQRSADQASQSDRGRVRVIVQPWGNVWIDDRFMGRAPFSGRLSEGRHVVAVGQDRPTKSRVIDVSSGRVAQIELDLEP